MVATKEPTKEYYSVVQIIAKENTVIMTLNYPQESHDIMSNVNMQQVQDTVDQLKSKHGALNFTQIQFRIWAELIIG